jgi:quercetin dioxygenase-like cupin family protein
MRWETTLFTMLICSVLVPTLAFATPPAGVVSNVIVAQGVTLGPVKERADVGDSWAVHLEDKGQSEFFFQDLVVGPGGYTGWHSHPGLLLITVKEGSVEFYDKECTKHTFAAGQSFTEGAEPHAAMNRGTGNARLLVAYIVKKGEPRRIEAPQPKCGATFGIP